MTFSQIQCFSCLTNVVSVHVFLQCAPHKALGAMPWRQQTLNKQCFQRDQQLYFINFYKQAKTINEKKETEEKQETEGRIHHLDSGKGSIISSVRTRQTRKNCYCKTIPRIKKSSLTTGMRVSPFHSVSCFLLSLTLKAFWVNVQLWDKLVTLDDILSRCFLGSMVEDKNLLRVSSVRKILKA